MLDMPVRALEVVGVTSPRAVWGWSGHGCREHQRAVLHCLTGLDTHCQELPECPFTPQLQVDV